LEIDSLQGRRSATRDIVSGTIYSKARDGDRDPWTLNEDLRGYWIAKNVRTILNEAASRRRYHRSVTATACNSSQHQALGNQDLLGVSAGANSDCVGGASSSAAFTAA
jgi:hypothetical protein